MPKFQVDIDLPTATVGEVVEMAHGSVGWKSSGPQRLRMGDDETLGEFIRRVNCVAGDAIRLAILDR